METLRLSALLNDSNDIVINLKPRQRMEIIDDVASMPLENVSITIDIPRDAHLTYTSRLIDTKRTHLADQKIVSNVALDLDATTKKIHFKFTGPGAHAEVKCTYFSGSHRTFRLKTIQDHLVANTTSTLVVNGVFEGTAQFFCDNLIQIHKDAQNVDAFQCNKNLLLSKTARAISIPKMEVEAHDVSCRHGTATSRIGDDELFYLQSRGMERKAAEEMLIRAFLA